MKVPIIDFSVYDDNDAYSLRYLADQIDSVLAEIGFMSVINMGMDWALVEEVFSQSRRYFALPVEEKKRCAYRSAAENFGYQGVCEENLDPSQPADIKESFIMRNIVRMAMADDRWPDAEFRACAVRFFDESVRAAYRMQRVLATALDQQRDFFVNCHSGENIALRMLHYPKWDSRQVANGQLGAGAHTDYGLITLLMQDSAGGLEVLTKGGDWLGVDHVPRAIIINCGDLLELWTNGRYRSTPHRVQPKTGSQERYSLAMFIDPDSDTMVEVLPSCITADKPVLFPPLTAGEHILRKIQATQKGQVVAAATSAGGIA